MRLVAPLKESTVLIKIKFAT